MDAPERPDGQYLGFQLAGEEYAFSILRVRELISYGVVTHVPSMPPWIKGVINLRGSVVPVVDLAMKFGLPPVEVTARTCIVIVDALLGGAQTLMGVLAEAVSRVFELKPEDIQPPPSFGTRVRAGCLVGMAKSDLKFVLLLDADKALAAEDPFDVMTPAETAPAERAAAER